MDKKVFDMFDKWPAYTQKLVGLYERLDALLTDLGLSKNEVRIIAFVSSMWRGELKFCDSRGNAGDSKQCLQINEQERMEDHLAELFEIEKNFSIFVFSARAVDLNGYDEFGAIPQKYEAASCYGIALECRLMGHSKILLELLNQISLFCKNVLDDEKLEIEEYMLANLVYIALKKQVNIDFYNILAAIPYEKRAPSGGILLLDDARRCDLKLSFEEKHPLEIKNVKEIRKLLEMATDELFLISADGLVMGLGSGCGELFLFNGRQMWSYYQNGRETLAYKEGKYTFIFEENENFISYFPRGFIDSRHHEHLNHILHEVRQQKHGTLLIISDEAAMEVGRICGLGRGYAIKPIDLKQAGGRGLLSSITSIDGALFVDTDLICHGIGVILDGIAVKAGLSSRGARYNSAQCYIDNKRHEKYVAVVVSGDETIDIIYNAS